MNAKNENRYVHGTRVVCPVLQPSGDSRVEVLDFNVHPSRAPTAAEKLAATRLGIDLERPPKGARLVCEPSVFPAGEVFSKEVVTALPYYAVPAPGEPDEYVGYMIDEQRLLGLKVCSVCKRATKPLVFSNVKNCFCFFFFTFAGESVYGFRLGRRRRVYVLSLFLLFVCWQNARAQSKFDRGFLL
jgi:hypothetical protein